MPSTSQSGLSSAEAASRLARDGKNELIGQGARSLGRIVREVLTEPMFLLLIAAACIYVTIGEIHEAAILGGSIFVVIGITVLQERRSERALAKLRDLSSPRALVIRDGVERRIAGRDVVVGDIVLLREGDRVPADAIVLEATALSIDESILTGESLPVEKIAATAEAVDDRERVYSGTLVVQGFGQARTIATGARSELGKIGRVIDALQPETTALFVEVRRLVRWVATAGVLLCTLIALIYGATRNDWLGGALAGITLAMSVLPEEFPLVLTVFLAMGAWRISQVNVLTRRLPALESIGAATILAVDKTGTLTENRMRVVAIEMADARFELQTETRLQPAAERVLTTALAASELQPFDPMERAIHHAAHEFAENAERRLSEMQLIREYDLTPDMLAVTHVWQATGEKQCYVASKGAPETILDLCKVPRAMQAELLERAAIDAQRGLRVLGVAQAVADSDMLPDTPTGFDLTFLGFICLADPLRADVPAALAECQQAGIRVVMITGDHPGTALSIATQAGFSIEGGVLTGAELDAMDDDVLRRRARDVSIYARAKPHHKLRLVQAFKADGNEVAMTGDGVNDAPALKAAHIGVAMGGRGTDVAREAAALVLVNDDFQSLVAAVRLGRRIYANIRHAMSYIVSVHIPIAGMGLLPVLFGWPLLLFPVHVLFLEFVIDPACAFVFEADQESEDLMRRPPRRRNEPLFSRETLKRSIGLGLVVLVVTTCTYGAALHWLDASKARALAFVSMVVANLALIFVSRSRRADFNRLLRRHNLLFWIVALIASAALAATIHVPAVAAVFRFSSPGFMAATTVAAATMLIVLATARLFSERK